MGTKRIVFDHPTPVGIDHLGSLAPGSDTVHPVIFVGKTTSRPAQVRYLDLFEGSDDVVAVAMGVGNGGIFAHPDASVDAMTEVFGEMTVNVATDGAAGLIGPYNDFGFLSGKGDGRGQHEQGHQAKVLFFHRMLN
ncbi:MAG: hypothetical protein BWY72_00914 [Bacteroidetes bacterium ADurb.Bin416]|nr:MAG: hypothetical protein BWY72_00914 [Bacteroidetes bacterium ADurb.Bin416]